MDESEALGPFGAPVPGGEEAAQLRADELSLFDATAVAVSSVAPAYTLASTVASILVIAGVGLRSPAVLILSFIPVLLVAHAYFHLNRYDPNCGASYSWLSQIFHPTIGWLNGWIQIWTSVLFCVSAPLLAGSYTLEFAHTALGLVSRSTVNSASAVAVAATFWLILVTAICVYGIRWTTNAQWVMVIIEYVVVIGFSVGGIIKVALHHPVHSQSFSWSWLNPLALHGWSAVAQGLALGVFFFWGWDTALNLNEESKDASRTPGRAALLSIWLLLFVFVLNVVAAEMLLGPRAIVGHGENMLFFFGQQLAGSWAGYVMVFAVLTSTVATTQTTLLPAARITYSMARDGVFPKLFAVIHGRYRTPAMGTLVVAIVSLAGITLTTLSSSSANVFNNLISNMGVLVALYYGMTGLACAWAFRRTWRGGARVVAMMILGPLLGGLVLLYVAYQVMVSGGMSAMPDVLVIVTGLPAMVWAWSRSRTAVFWRQPRITHTRTD